MLKPIENFEQVETQGKFALWLNRPIYKIYKIDSGYIRNIRTGENMGKQVVLRVRLHDESNLPLSDCKYDEDCYEFVEEEDE